MSQMGLVNPMIYGCKICAGIDCGGVHRDMIGYCIDLIGANMMLRFQRIWRNGKRQEYEKWSVM